MMDPERFQEIFGRRISVHGVMHKQIKRVTEKQTGYNAKNELPENKLKSKKQERSNEQAYNGRHRQAVFVFRKIVVVAVEGVLDIFLHRRVGFHVENVAVRQILDKRENKPAHKKQPYSRKYIQEAVQESVNN